MLFVKRIHIGRWKKEDDWYGQMQKQLEKQIKKPTRVPATTFSGTALSGLFGKGPYPENLQCWLLATLISASPRKISLEEKSVKRVPVILKRPGSKRRRLIQDPSLAMLTFYLWQNNKELSPELEEMIADIYKELKTFVGTDGSICYNKSENDKRLVDTVGMACPFLIKYGIEKGESEAVTLALKQIEYFYDHGFDKKTGLPYHCYDIQTHNKGGIIGWGRGCGWWAIGLTESFRLIEKSLDGKAGSSEENKVLTEYKNLLMGYIEDFAESILKGQMQNGAWSRHLFFDTVGDTSATAILAWFLTETKNILKNDIESEAIKKALAYLKSNTRRDGLVDFSQGDTMGMGFYSASLIPMPIATAFCLRALESRKQSRVPENTI